MNTTLPSLSHAALGAVVSVAVVLASPHAAAQQAGAQNAPKKTPLPAISPDADDDANVVRYPPSSVRFPLILGGIAVTGAAYGIGAGMASAWPEVPGSERLYIPVAGPWIALAENECSPDTPDCGAILVMRGILYAVSGLAQLGGLGIVAEGLFMTTEAVPAGGAKKKPEKKKKKPAVEATLAPVATPEFAGVGVLGRF